MGDAFASRGLFTRCHHPTFCRYCSACQVPSALSGSVDKTVVPGQNGIRNRALPAFRTTSSLSFGWPRPNATWTQTAVWPFSQRDGVMHYRTNLVKSKEVNYEYRKTGQGVP
jgi:hypothetical protein